MLNDVHFIFIYRQPVGIKTWAKQCDSNPLFKMSTQIVLHFVQYSRLASNFSLYHSSEHSIQWVFIPL